MSEPSEQPPRARAIIVCVNHRLGLDTPSCAARGSAAIAKALDVALRETDVSVLRIKCFGRCAEGPNVRIAGGGAFFRAASVDDIPAMLRALRVSLSSTDC